MKSYLLSFVLILFTLNLFAQNPAWGGGRGGNAKKGPSIKGKISGSLIDSLSNAPVEFATVVLIDPKQKKEINGVISDEKGFFKIQDVSNGTYELHISFLGYRKKVISDVTTTLEKPDINLEQIYMMQEGVNLQEVTVTGQAAIYENKIDKIVYNAEKDVTTVGGDATDVLRRVPLLSVDLEGNVSLRGSSNIQILINIIGR